MKERITGTDTGISAMIKMSDGNPGALTVLTSIMQQAAAIDPDDFLGALGPILGLDTLGVYGSEIWMLYNDVCDQNITGVLTLLRANQLGMLSNADLMKAIRGNGYGSATLLPKPISEYLADVQERLPRFAEGMQI